MQRTFRLPSLAVASQLCNVYAGCCIAQVLVQPWISIHCFLHIKQSVENFACKNFNKLKKLPNTVILF